MGNLCNMHAGSWNMHVGICNMHVETQHLFLMGAESDYLEFRVRLTTSAQRFAEVSAAGPLRNPMTQNAGVLSMAAPRR
jgi:hypothetical protein